MALVQALVIALVALILAPGYLFYFDVTPKVVVLLAGTAVSLVAAAVSGVSIPAKSRPFVVFSILSLLYVGSLALATAISSRPDFSLFGATWRRFGSVIEASVCLFAWLLALGCAGRPARVRTVLRGVTTAGALSAVYGIAQYFGWDPFLPAAGYHVGEGIFTIVRPPGTLGHGDYFATWLLFVLFLSLALRTVEPSSLARSFTLSTAVLAGCAMLLTGTRAAVLGFGAGALVWTAVGGVREFRRLLPFAGIAVLACAAFYFAPTGRQMRARAHWFADDPWGGDRLGLWRDSLRMARYRLPAGYGPEVFTAQFPRFESLELARHDPDFGHESAHNMFLDALVAQGLPGMLLLAALCASGLLAAVRLKQPAFAAVLAAGIVSQQFSALTLTNALMLWVTLGLLVALDAPPAERRRHKALMAGAAVVAALLLYGAARLTIADHALARVKNDLDRGDLPRAIAQYRKYQTSHLPGGSPDIWYSRALLRFASQAPQLQLRVAAAGEAGTAAVRATQTAEDPYNAWYNLAVFCGTQNDSMCVERSLRQAIAANPMWFKPHWALAEVLRLTGRMQEAQEEATRAAELDGGKDAEVTRALQQIRAERAPGSSRFQK
jgi:tetratricopeptide (TPR) repeat protein